MTISPRRPFMLMEPSAVRRLLVLFLLLGFFGIALAEENVWNEETFEYYASIIRQQPDTHSRLIDGCAQRGILKMDSDTKAQIERDSSMSASEATKEVCRRVIKGIASGAVTYEVFRKWANAPDDEKVSFPDYQ
ncbi:hypothetical protein [Rhizobium mongolense]|uniref:hypothetical protein n=1 Tax=Rhizobium mongolense TaxID=57676 RepID=UPI0034A59E45